MTKEDKPLAAVKRAAVVLDDGGWPIDPPVTASEVLLRLVTAFSISLLELLS
jgi:hypothetical protein